VSSSGDKRGDVGEMGRALITPITGGGERGASVLGSEGVDINELTGVNMFMEEDNSSDLEFFLRESVLFGLIVLLLGLFAPDGGFLLVMPE
jgi:hypothetical protein